MTNLLHGAHVANKLFSTIARLRLLLVMFVTLTVSAEVWGAEEVVYTLTPTEGSNSSYTGNCDILIDGITWNLTGNSQMIPWRIGGKSLTNVNRALYSKTPISNNISKIIIEHGTASSITVNSVKLFVSTKENGAGTIISELSNSFSVSSTMTFTRPDGKDWTNAYYKIVYNVTVSSTSNKFLQFTNAKFYSSGSGGSTTVDPEVTFSNGEYTVGGAALDLSTLWESNSTGAVTYSVTNANGTGATINGTSFTATAAGSCTVQATQAATASHNTITKTATITVIAAAGGGGSECTWELVTDASDLKAGDQIVITAAEVDMALSTTQQTNNRTGTAITKTNNKLEINSFVQILILEEGSESGTFAFKDTDGTNNGYLYAASSSSNHLKTKAEKDKHGAFSIEINGKGVASIQAKASSNRNVLRYNPGNTPPLFSCYESGKMSDVSIYKKVCTAKPTSFTITFEANGGTKVDPISDATALPNPLPETTRNHYTFAGWFTDEDCTQAAEADATIDADITLYAKWTAKTYTITLDANGGTFVDNRDSQTKGSATFDYIYGTYATYSDAPNLTEYYTDLKRDGYQFEGWVSAGSPWNKLFTSTGDRTIQAQWSKLYSITLFENGTTKELDAQTSTSYTLPEALSVGNCENDEKELVGWSTVAIPNPGEKPTSKFYELGATVTLTADQTTFYAVFATVDGGGVENVDATLSFENTAQRTSLSTSQQVWEQNGITLTNDQASSTSNVGDFANPARFYKSSNITIEAPGKITKIVFTCNTEEYATNLATSIGDSDLASGTIVTLILDGTSDSYEVTLSDGQVRMNSLTVTYTTGSGTSYSDYTTSCVKLPDPVLSFATEPANPIVFTDAVCGGNSSKQSVTVVGENLRDVVAVSVTGPYKIARTSSTALKDFTTSLTLDKTDAGAIHSNYKTVYIISTPPAQSTEATTGTLTFTTTKGNTLTVNLSTPTVTCTQYTLTLIDRGVSTEQPTKYYAGETINEAPDAPEGVCTDPIHYVFDGWAAATVAEGSTTYTKVTFPYTVTGNTKFYAVYRYVEDGSADSGDYMKVTENLDDYSGDYLIVYEAGSLALNGALVGEGLDASGNSISVTITDNTIVATDEVNASNFTIAKEDDGYSIRSASGYYIGQTTNANDLKTNSTEYYANTITLSNDDNADVVSSGAYLRYNAATGNTNLRFRYYKSDNYTSQKAIALYRKAASYLYTTSPACGSMLEITSGKDIYVTSGYGTGRNTVIAQQTVEYRATRLKTQNGSAEGTAPDVKVAANGVTMGGVVTNNVKVVELTQNKELVGDKYTITGTVTVQYTPTANDLQEDIQVQLAVDYNMDAKDNFTVHARSLPEEFVIVAKQGDKWYALNADMSGIDAEKANGYLQVDDIEDPTKATFAPCNTIYTFDGMVDGGNKEYMRFQGIDGKYLWAASAGNTGIQNYAKNTPAAGTIAYNWQLYTNDNETYQLQNEGNGRTLGLSKDLNFGMYSYVSTLQQDIRILPYEAKCIYNYAPTNLKVSELKSTSVILTWDAVAGATKYQYSTNGTTWTDAGTEPTVTINDLTVGTKYTYYVRAYHEDTGVSQECIDYAEITFTTANCDDVPTDITYTADLNSITVSWTATAPTATIKLYMNEDGTGGGGTYPGATSPYKISGGLNPNTTYYIQILAGGDCASPIVPVKTEDVEVDIVEWQPQGIIVDINTDETIGVTLENEVSYGSGTGSEATELFFSKYYEASYNVKLVAIYNGTKNIIDLTDYIIKYGKTSWETNYITLKDFGATKGQIQPGEEIILYSMQDRTQDDEIMDCVHEDFPDGNWVRVTSSNNTGKGTLSFAGDKTLALFKGADIIDIIGAVNGSIPDNSKANAKPSWGDGKGWICATGLSLADDSEIGISTNRCLLVRNNTVTSGANAVANNTTDFVTLCSEWKGAHVLDSDVDNGIQESCENFAYVGTFDYSDYYTQYESMGDEKEFDENARNADGTVTIPITDLYKQSCRNIRITLEDKDGNVISNREYKVPIMITTSQGTDGEAFIALQENLAMIETDANGNPTGTKTNLTLEQAKEICKTCDVVVRNGATLMKMADDAANDHPQVHDVIVYEGASLVVPNGTNYTINNLSLRRKGDEVASLNVYPDALKLPESSAAPISLDFRLSAESWHWFTLPYDCNISEVTWVDGSPAQYNVDWFLMTYDGEKRAATQAGGCWKAHTGTTIKAGEGFILAINGNINNPEHTYELRFPMSKEVLAAEGTDKTVDVRAWGVETNIRPNHKGWNLVGNPYLAYYQRNNITNFEGLRLGQLTGPDLQTGYWEQTGDVPYVVVPVGAGWIAYEQVLASETDLLPFTAYFVQVGNDGKHASSDELSISFDHTKLQLSATPMPASLIRRAPSEIDEVEEPVIVGVSLTNSLGESDKTSLVIDNQFTDEYEMNADFFKWFGDYYKYYTKPVVYSLGADNGKRAFNALSEDLATQPISLGMYAAQAGNYTFTLDRRSDLSKVQEVWLYDATQDVYTNLMQDSYTFNTAKTESAGRFFLSVKMAPKVTTDTENLTSGSIWATTHNKTITINGLLSNSNVWVYDATGKLLHADQTQYYQHSFSVPQTGAYFIRVHNNNEAQTIAVVVE